MHHSYKNRGHMFTKDLVRAYQMEVKMLEEGYTF
jgi:hypothetical protein